MKESIQNYIKKIHVTVINFQYDCMRHSANSLTMVLLRIISSKHPFKASRNGFKEKQNEETTNQETDESVRDRNMVFRQVIRPPPLSLVRQRLPLQTACNQEPRASTFPGPSLGLFLRRSKTSIFLILYQMPAVEANSWVTGLETACLNTSFL